MNITKQRLKEIIREELKEASVASWSDDKKTLRWKVYIVGEKEPLILTGRSASEVKKFAHQMIQNNKVKIKNKHLLTIDELEPKEVSKLIDFALDLKKHSKTGKENCILKNKTLAMLFEKPSTRTRVSFETGMFQLGGHSLTLSINDFRLSR